MDIKEIREDLDTYCAVINQNDWTGQLYSLACSLLSEVEGLQNTIAQMQDVEQTIYECRMKGGDAVRHLLDSLLAENKQLKDSLYKNSRVGDYTLLEERCAKLEKENAALREVVEAAKAYMGSVDINFQYAKGSLIELNDALKKIKENI